MRHSSLPEHTQRRLLLAGLAGLAAGAAAPARADDLPPRISTSTSATFPVVLPGTEFVYESVVDLAPTLPLGASPFGERRMVPIVGGTFEGPGLRGKVKAGGADRQLVRRDGAVSLDAVYERDAVVIRVYKVV